MRLEMRYCKHRVSYENKTPLIDKCFVFSTNSQQLTLNTIQQTRQDLSGILSELNTIHNSKIAINKVIPDILYDIFTLAINNSPFPGTTIFYISHVCRHWRNSALEWPSLWGFVDISARPLIPLFMNRSGNAPLTFSWTTRYHFPLFEYPMLNTGTSSNPKLHGLYRLSKSYFESLASHVLPRLSSMTLHLTYLEFMGIRHVFQDSGSLPLRLRSLDLGLYSLDNTTGVGDIPWTDLLPVDVSYLRVLRLREVALPWPEPPHHKLTHFSIHYPKKVPTLSQLLTFLSHCPLLVELEVALSVDVPQSDSNITISEDLAQFKQPIILETNQLDFPNLCRLELAIMGRTNEYMKCLARHIRTMGSLSCFDLKYDYAPSEAPDSANIFDLVPSETFSHFANHRYLYINLFRHTGNFLIYSGPRSDDSRRRPSSGFRTTSFNHPSPKPLFPLYISGLGQPGRLFDHAPFLQLIRFMPEITHLELVSSAWELFTSWEVDIRTAFPRLETLELSGSHHPVRDCVEVLQSLPSDFKLKTLILKRVRVEIADALLDVVSRMGIQVVELGECYNEVDYSIILALRNRGTIVNLPEEPVFNLLQQS